MTLCILLFPVYVWSLLTAASVQFLQDSYTFREGQGSGNITVVLNGAVSSPLTVTVTDGEITINIHVIYSTGDS